MTQAKAKDKKVDNSVEPGSNTKTNEGTKPVVPIIVMIMMFIIAIGFALILAPTYVEMGMQADFEELGLGDEQSLLIPVFYIVVIVVFTAIILFITRKRRGGFIKYAFLGVIGLSMIYVFWAIFDSILFPIPPQQWSNELEVQGGVNTILIADLLGDGDDEIIIGTSNGILQVYDDNNELVGSTEQPLPGVITTLAVEDLNRDSRPELIVNSGTITIFEHEKDTQNENLKIIWNTTRNDYTSLAVIPDYPLGGNTSFGRTPAVLVGESLQNNLTIGNLGAISYYNDTYHLDTIMTLDFPINTMAYGRFNNTNTQELYIGTARDIYSIDPMNPKSPKPIAVDLGVIIGIQIKDIDNNGASELVAWNNDGKIFIYKANKPEVFWDHKPGDHIGGVAFDDLFNVYDGNEFVVSVDGRVYIYYSEDVFLDREYELTEETGRLNSLATGLAIGDLDDNEDPDIVVGHQEGFNQYQYKSPIYSDVPCFMALIVSVILTVLLFYYPEWYLVDIVGIIVAGGVTALIGVSIGLLPIVVLLIILAIYDAISVYKTKHMVSLADKVMEFKLPILLVVPKKRGYSFLRQKGLRKQLEDGEEREAMFIGLGDIIIPGTLVISAFHFLPATGGFFGISANLLVAIFTLFGILLGFSALMHFVLKGNPQAGLPLLNTGAIVGFLISNFILYQDLTFGFVLPLG